jgi:hypothetical protein
MLETNQEKESRIPIFVLLSSYPPKKQQFIAFLALTVTPLVDNEKLVLSS